jgi:hypothetical protein
MTGYEDLKPSEIEECKEQDNLAVDKLATFVELTVRKRLLDSTGYKIAYTASLTRQLFCSPIKRERILRGS